MKVVINGVCYDSNEVPVVLVWDTDKERQATGSHISEMPPIDRVRAYASYPDGMDGGVIMANALRLAGAGHLADGNRQDDLW